MAKKKKSKVSSKVQVVQAKKQSSQVWTITLIVVLGFVSLIFILFIVDTLKNKGTNPTPTNGQQQTRDFEGEIQQLQTQLNSNPNDITVLTQLGNTYYDSQNWSMAIENYNKAYKLSPNDPNLITDLATSYFYTSPSQPEKAIELYDKALKVQPGFQNAMLNKGIVLRDGLKKPKEAIEVWNEYLGTPKATETGRVKKLIEDTEITLKNN